LPLHHAAFILSPRAAYGFGETGCDPQPPRQRALLLGKRVSLLEKAQSHSIIYPGHSKPHEFSGTPGGVTHCAELDVFTCEAWP
jgi:hypothetical protein